MADDTAAEPGLIGANSLPKLPRSVKLRHDAGRDRWVVLAPEKVFLPNAVAPDVLRLCDGTRAVSAIAGELVKSYDVPAATILGQVLFLRRDLAAKGVVTA